jgi:hypothetical protein
MNPSDPLPTATRLPNQSAPRLPQCPVCAGVLVPLRGFFRCSRCYFSLCVSCEGGVEAADMDRAED